MKLHDRVAIVTGAASGIGRASAIAFAREGARVAVVDRNERGGAETVSAIQSEGGEAFFAGVDVTSAYPGIFPDAYDPVQVGTSFAAAFVSGVVALVRSAHPRLTAAQVVARIEATAGGAAGPGTGHGLVDPVRAVTAVLPAGFDGAETTASARPAAQASGP